MVTSHGSSSASDIEEVSSSTFSFSRSPWYVKARRIPSAESACAMAQAIERLFATPKMIPVFPSNKPIRCSFCAQFIDSRAMKRAAILFALLLAATSAFAEKRAFGIEDLYRIRTVGDLSMSPDGKTLAFTIATSDLARAKRSTAVWVINTDG